MFSKKSDDKKKKGRPGQRDNSRLAQFGLLDIENMNIEESADPSDDALEAELLALMEGGPKPSSARPQRKATENVAPAVNLDKMVAECMADNDDVEVTSDDENDPALMEELMGLDEDYGPPPVPPKSTPAPTVNAPIIQNPAPIQAGHSVLRTLEERIANYERAEAQAIIDNETARLRRIGRGLKTLRQMKKSLLAGKAVNETDIPPEVLIKSTTSSPPVLQSPDSGVNVSPTDSAGEQLTGLSGPPPGATRVLPPGPVPQKPIEEPKKPSENTSDETRVKSANSLPQGIAFPQPTTDNSKECSHLTSLQSQYRKAALSAKQAGDAEQAKSHLIVAKQLQLLIDAVNSGQPVDMNSLPPPPGNVSAAVKSEPPTEVMEVPDIPDLPPVATETIMSALEERLGVYVKQLEKAKSEGNARKERMNQRIVKQYQDAIKRRKLGKPCDLTELPVPPGFNPMPSAAPVLPPKAPEAAPALPPKAPQTAPALKAPEAAPAPNGAVGPSPPKKQLPSPNTKTVPQNVRAAPKSRVERQMSLLQTRQDQFKMAALEAKKKGEIEQAKEYLRNSKGISHLLQATASGLPVDMNTVPIPPQETAAGGPTPLGRENSVDLAFEVINSEDCTVPSDSTDSDIALIYTKLEEDLIQQIKMCATTREHFKAVGDVASSNRFEQLILHTKKDLDAVRLAFKRQDKPPRCHYENRSFAIVQCNTDLNDSDCQVTVVRGINYNVSNPKDIDTYAIIEFPYPSDAPPQDKSGVVKDSNNPVYEHKNVFSIDRKTRALARVFKRQSVKVTIWAKGGWFHRHTMLGYVKVPLVALENKCTIHDSFDLMDDRKKMVGGKVEVKVRVRNPILNKQVEQINEKWLVIDGF